MQYQSSKGAKALPLGMNWVNDLQEWLVQTCFAHN